MNYFPGGISPWPSNYLLVELFISGAWTAITLSELSDDGVSITRGGRPGSFDQDPGSLTFSLKDPTGKWSPRHPSSPYYGLIGRGTKIRVRVRNHGTGAYFNRFSGEIVSFTPAWTKKGGPSARVDVEASGVLRRLGQGKALAKSALRRYLETSSNGVVAYWPMEDATGATSYASNGAAGPFEATKSGVVAAQSASLQGSDPLPEINGGSLKAGVPRYTATGLLQIRAIIKNGSATPNGTPFLRLNFTGGSVAYIDLIYSNSTQISVQAYRSDGSAIAGGATTTFNLGANIYMMQLTLDQAGGALNWEFVNTNYLINSTLFGAGVWSSSTQGRLYSIQANPTNAAEGNSIVGHVSVATLANPYNSKIYGSMNGFSGESAVTRLNRLADELGIELNGDVGPWPSPRSESMGYQKSGVILDLMQECADVDLGILRESTLDTEDLFYVTSGAMYSPPASARSDFSYVENLFNPFVPVEDDQGTANRVTVTRNVGGGGTATSEQLTGALGVNTVGAYEDSVSLNLDSPSSVRPQADWRVHIGTWDEARWPQIGVDLADYRIVGQQVFQEKVLNRDIGQVINITGIPAWLPPFDVSQIITGITETILTDSHKVTWSCVPARPLRVGHWMVSASAAGSDRWDGAGTTLFSSVSASATSIVGTLPTGVQWTVASGSYPVNLNGEIMTVTNVTAPASGRQTFTVTRAVNGVAKAHTAGEQISLSDPAYWSL